MMSEVFECCNVFINAAFLHAKSFEVVSCTLVLGIVDEHVTEVAFQDLLGCHAEWDGCFSILDLVKPLV